MKRKTIITAALNGSQGTKEKNPNTPITVSEIIEDAYQCYLNGAAIVHIHLKNDDGISPEINNEKFSEIKKGIQSKCDIIVNFSTSGEVFKCEGLEFMGTPDGHQQKRLDILNTKPEIATFDVPTMNFGERVFMNPLPFLRNLGKKLQDLSILPEVEIYTEADIIQIKKLIDEESVQPNPYYQFCLGIHGGSSATVKSLLHLYEALPDGANWSAFGIGKHHLPIMYATLALGGNIRVGLEDNLYYTKGELTSNVELVQRASRVITEFGNEIATPDEAREMLGLSK